MHRKIKYCLLVLLPLFISLSCKQHTENAENVGTIAKDSASIQKTLQALDAKIAKEPQNADLYYRKSQLYITQKHLQPAFENIVKALNIDSAKSAYYIPLSDCYFATGQVGRAKRVLEKALALDNTNTDALLKLAELYLYVEK